MNEKTLTSLLAPNLAEKKRAEFQISRSKQMPTRAQPKQSNSTRFEAKPTRFDIACAK